VSEASFVTTLRDVEKGKTHRKRAFSTFRRSIGFPESVDTERVSARMAEGILKVRLPKLESRPAKKTRRLTL
jgi:HSP20 family molecular chaperone IbpA